MLQLAGCAWRSQLHFEVCYTVILIHVLVLKTTFLNAVLLFLSALLKSDFSINWLLLRKKKIMGQQPLHLVSRWKTSHANRNLVQNYNKMVYKWCHQLDILIIMKAIKVSKIVRNTHSLICQRVPYVSIQKLKFEV